MPIARDIIDRVLGSPHGEAAYKICEKLIDAGHECWWVGGAVRNMLVGIIPGEIDMATSALPDQIQKLFPKSDDSAAALGAVIVSQSGHTFELTTFREDDSASDGRHPESVKFSKDLKYDALRRDATINALYWNPISRELIDPCGGEGDLKERLVRLIGEPTQRLKHDVLRILRMVRLRAAIDGQYEPATYQALRAIAPSTTKLSGTRILQELEKLLAGERPQIGLEDLWELGVMKVIIPELYICKGIAQPKDYHHEGDVWNHLLKCCASFSDDHQPDVRLAALFHDCGKAKTFSREERIRFDHHAEVSSDITETVLRRLQMPGNRTSKISWIIRHHMMMGSFKELSDERKAHWYFHPWFQELLQLMYLDIAGTDPSDFTLYDAIVDDYDAFLNAHPRPPKPLLTGDEVMEILGLKPGEQVGKILKSLHEAQVRKEIRTKKEAKEYLTKLKE
ncbi:MAG: CCA tRNA nucleotidyltransferase [Candidatus Peribacteraceae bacterium]|nr:CCA tRNA nucleotidyltransferase [Candidatus Peribacteraceae bacterium]